MSSPIQKTLGSDSISSQSPCRIASRYVAWAIVVFEVPSAARDPYHHQRSLVIYFSFLRIYSSIGISRFARDFGKSYLKCIAASLSLSLPSLRRDFFGVPYFGSTVWQPSQ